MNSYQNNNDKNLVLENIQIFEKILKLEISNDYSNTSVSGGGLDEYIEKNIVYFNSLRFSNVVTADCGC